MHRLMNNTPYNTLSRNVFSYVMSCTRTYITLFAQLYQAVIHACTSPRQQELVVLPIPWHRMMCPISHISQ